MGQRIFTECKVLPQCMLVSHQTRLLLQLWWWWWWWWSRMFRRLTARVRVCQVELKSWNIELQSLDISAGESGINNQKIMNIQRTYARPARNLWKMWRRKPAVMSAQRQQMEINHKVHLCVRARACLLYMYRYIQLVITEGCANDWAFKDSWTIWKMSFFSVLAITGK